MLFVQRRRRPPDAQTGASILRFLRERVCDFKLVWLIEFSDLPKITSGKVRRVEYAYWVCGFCWASSVVKPTRRKKARSKRAFSWQKPNYFSFISL